MGSIRSNAGGNNWQSILGKGKRKQYELELAHLAGEPFLIVILND